MTLSGTRSFLDRCRFDLHSSCRADLNDSLGGSGFLGFQAGLSASLSTIYRSTSERSGKGALRRLAGFLSAYRKRNRE